MRKENTSRASQNIGPKHRHQLALADRVGGHERGLGWEALRKLVCLPKPAHNVIKRLPEPIALLKEGSQIALLIRRLRTQSRVRRISANEGFASFVFKIDLGLV